MVSTGDERYDATISRMLEFETDGDFTLDNRPSNTLTIRERSRSTGSALHQPPLFHHAGNAGDSSHPKSRPARKSFSIGTTLKKARSSILSSFHKDIKHTESCDTYPKPHNISNVPHHRLRTLPLGRTPNVADLAVEEDDPEFDPASRHATSIMQRGRPAVPVDSTRLATSQYPSKDQVTSKLRGKEFDGNQFGRNKDRESGIDMTLDLSTEVLASPDVSSSSRGAEPRLDPVTYLPSELSVSVFSYLDAQSLARCGCVSRSWNAVANDRVIWQTVFTLKYGSIARDRDLLAAACGSSIGKTLANKQDWKAVYQMRKELAQNWTTANDVEATYLHGHTDSVYCVQFDEDKIITGSRDRTIRVWDIHTYQLRKVIGIPHAYETDVREYGVTHRLPLPEHERIKISRAEEPHPDPSIYCVPSIFHNASILCLQYDDEICVTGSSDTSLIVWDIKTWKPLRRLERHAAGVLDIAMDKRLIISCSKDSSLCIWDRQTGMLLKQLTGHRGPVNAVQLRNNLVVSASGEGCAKVWRLESKNLGTNRAQVSVESLRDLWSEDRGLACVEFSENAKHILAGGNDQVIYKFNSESGQTEVRMEGHENLVRSLYLDSANGRVISGSYDLSLRVWDFETGKQILAFPQWATSWMLSAKSDYRRIVSTSQDGRVMVLDFAPHLSKKQA